MTLTTLISRVAPNRSRCQKRAAAFYSYDSTRHTYFHCHPYANKAARAKQGGLS